jgi:hypothetical protein
VASSGEDNADAAMAGQLIAREPGPVEVYGDSAYGTGELRTALAGGGRAGRDPGQPPVRHWRRSRPVTPAHRTPA